MHRTLLRLAVPLAIAAALTASACLPASPAETPPPARTSLALPAGLPAPALDGISGWAGRADGDPRDGVQMDDAADGTQVSVPGRLADAGQA
ncbi:hypothetical protein [Streptomyces sp. W1SF4]|uniref:hypothetical protein n=1 Tax=Streptomyces sp. W1SF4 TaxID=2305220 RepID=UPI000F717BD9|nr:hypothetical protein [Streptomyces sp. W1SF4]AZM93802.1 hypothetical protein D1J60_35370 [Streptomyces sp. W1SF4]